MSASISMKWHLVDAPVEIPTEITVPWKAVRLYRLDEITALSSAQRRCDY
jgi:hypothetical protein